MTMKRNDDAVSPVIGVILMVAITVILAAVIAAFVFGLVGNVQGAKVVGVTVAQTSSNTADITWQGGADMGSITSWYKVTDTNTRHRGPYGTPTVGQVDTFNFTSPQRVILNATFQDGTSQVIFDKQF